MASAPWARHQFDLKGVDALLEATKALPYVKLILLWRGVLLDDLMARIRRLGIEQRVEIVNEHVDVNVYLARAHATVLVAKSGDVVKSYPHSLVGIVACGPSGDHQRQHIHGGRHREKPGGRRGGTRVDGHTHRGHRKTEIELSDTRRQRGAY